jgi:hypothetical protein
MKLRSIVAGMAGSVAISTGALAADPIFIAPPPPPPMVVAPAGFDWSGPYAGAAVLIPGFAVEGHFGVNFVRGSLLFGIEGLAGFVVGGGGAFIFGGSAKAGFLLGPTQRIAVYATALAAFTGGTSVVVGGGVAFGLGDRLSVFGEGLYNIAATAGGIRAGVNFHFGN